MTVAVGSHLPHLIWWLRGHSEAPNEAATELFLE